jgi:hypothetical protein
MGRQEVQDLQSLDSVRAVPAASEEELQLRLEVTLALARAVNRAHAQLCAVGEQGVATVKNWRILRRGRCGPLASVPSWPPS